MLRGRGAEVSTKEMGAREQRLRDPASCPRGYRETLEYAQSLTGGRVLDTDLSACIRHGVLTSIHAIIHTQLATHSGTAACSGSTLPQHCSQSAVTQHPGSSRAGAGQGGHSEVPPSIRLLNTHFTPTPTSPSLKESCTTWVQCVITSL